MIYQANKFKKVYLFQFKINKKKVKIKLIDFIINMRKHPPHPIETLKLLFKI